MYFFRVMPIQSEWHYGTTLTGKPIVRQWTKCSPCTLIVFDRTYYCTGTCNNGKVLHFYSAVVIKSSLFHLFFTNRGRRLGASSRFKTWSLVFWCLLLRHSRLFNDRPRQISINIIDLDLVLTP